MDNTSATPDTSAPGMDDAPAQGSASAPVGQADSGGDGPDAGLFFVGEKPGLEDAAANTAAATVTAGALSAVGFDFREFALNPIVEACSGLLALFTRLQDLEVLQDSHGLRQRVADEIRRIEVELEGLRYITDVDDMGNVTGRRVGYFDGQKTGSGGFESGLPLYDFPVVNALKYCLCTMIDEGVMGNNRPEVGENPAWRQESLLAEFHNETWGGEKVFLIKDRLIREPGQYQDFLEFLFLMFTLGYRGKYRVAYSGQERFQRVVDELYSTIRDLRGEVNPIITEPLANLTVTPEHIKPQLPPSVVVIAFLVVIAVIFALFWFRVEGQTTDVLTQLDALLATQADNSTVPTRNQ